MSSNFDIYLPKFNDAHTLDPSGEEEGAERWGAWNELSFDLLDYMSNYWFWLGAPTNEYLTNQLAEAEYLISWSTCYHFRWLARRTKSFGHQPAKGNRTLEEALNFVPQRSTMNNPAIKLSDDRKPALWQPPAQIYLMQPDPPGYIDDPRPFAERLQEYKELRKEERRLIKTNKAHRSKPRIAPRKTGYRGLAAGPRKR